MKNKKIQNPIDSIAMYEISLLNSKHSVNSAYVNQSESESLTKSGSFCEESNFRFGGSACFRHINSNSENGTEILPFDTFSVQALCNVHIII